MKNDDLTAGKSGYRILLIAFLANVVGTGVGFYGFGVFFKPLSEYFGGRALVGVGNMLSLLVAALWAPRVGKAVDRFGPRPLLIGGALGSALALALMSGVSEYWQYLLLIGVMFSLSNLHIGDIVTSSTVARQFPGNPGRALGIATVGVSFGGVLVPPLAQLLLEWKGWRAGFVGLSVLSLALVLIPAALLLKGFGNGRAPDRNVQPPAPEAPDNDVRLPSLTRSEAMKSPVFWKMVAMFGLSFLPLGTMLVQQVPFLTDMGISPRKAAMTLSITAIMGMAGKVSWGYIFDRVEGRYAVSAAIGLQALAIIWLLNAHTLWQAIIFGAMYGFGMGGLVPLHTAFRLRQFGVKHIGAIMGVSSPFIMIAQAGGQPFSGWVFDTTGSYRYAFLLFIACYAISITIALTLKDPARVTTDEHR